MRHNFPHVCQTTISVCPASKIANQKSKIKGSVSLRGPISSSYAPTPSDTHQEYYPLALLDDTESLVRRDWLRMLDPPHERRRACPELLLHRHKIPFDQRESFAAYPRLVSEKPSLVCRAADLRVTSDSQVVQGSLQPFAATLNLLDRSGCGNSSRRSLSISSSLSPSFTAHTPRSVIATSRRP